MASRIKDITGNQYGSLTALDFSHTDASKTAHWRFQCTCGKIHIARANTITHQARKQNDVELPSCGCVELSRKTKHGYRKASDTHYAYRSFRGMLDRCYNPNSPAYKWYGAKGVTVSPEWKDNPEKFVEWSIANGWKTGLHIDKDILCKEKGIFPHIYSPETCQWVTAKVNVGFATNRNNYGSHPNVKLSHTEVAEILGYYFRNELTISELALRYSVDISSIYRLVRIANGGTE